MASRIPMWLLPIVLAPTVASAGIVPLQGTLYFSEDFNTNGLYTLDTDTGDATHVGDSGVVGRTVGLAPTGDQLELWGSEWFGLNQVQADGLGVDPISEIPEGGGLAEGMAFDPETGTLYGAINTEFFTIDTATGEVDTLLDDGDIDYEGLAFGNGGIYGLPGFTDDDTHLWFFELKEGAWSIVGDTEIDWIEAGLAFDPINNVLYAKNGRDSTLYQIDPTTGFTSVIGDTGILSGGGLAFVVPEPQVLSFLLVGIVFLVRRSRR